MESFNIAVRPDQIADLQNRIKNTRWPNQLNQHDDWQAGTTTDFAMKLANYWHHEFNWLAIQEKLNQQPHFRTKINNMQVHFLHYRSAREDAIPLILSHGWPGSFIEFEKLIPLLTNPSADQPAFHLVIPSLPGYGFSDGFPEKGGNTAAIAGVFIKLMDELGYQKFGAQGGDWGSPISAGIARAAPDRCIGLHLNMVVAFPPAENMMDGVTEQEMLALQRFENWQGDGNGYFNIQATRPNTLGFGLTDSPLGLASWIAEKFRDWSDCNGDVLSVYSYDQLLTNISLYWYTGSITSAARLYHEERLSPSDMSYVSVPTAGAVFPQDIINSPKAWALKQYNIQQWSTFESGGHFAAMEKPVELAKDIQQFFSQLTKS